MKVFWENLNKIDQFSGKLTLYINYQYINFALFKFLVLFIIIIIRNRKQERFKQILKLLMQVKRT